MRNIFKSLFILAACLATTVAWAQVQSFTAAEIKSGAKKEAVSVSTDLNVTNKQMCKENSKGVKLDAVEGGNSANTVDEKYVQISSTAEMSKIYLHATFNSSGNGEKMAFLYWKENVTPAVDNILGAELVSFPGYDGACDANYVTVTPPSDARIVRIYRQLKNFDGTGYKKGATYGENTTFLIADIDVTAGPAPKSTDATLKDLQIGGVTIDDFSSSVTEYNYVIAATATTMPTITATKNDSKASDPVITPASMPTAGNPTQATVSVTAEDGETKLTYTITFTRAELSHDATLKEIKVDGVAISGFTPSTETYSVAVPFSQTSLPIVSATANNSGAQPLQITQATDVPGDATILVTAEDGTTKKTYTISFTHAAASSDATLKALTYNGISVPGFSALQTAYNVELAQGSAKPVVAAETTHPFAKAEIEQAASTNGTATINVTAEDGNTTKQYTITFTEVEGPPVPSTTLTLHEPGIYEEEGQYGGYGLNLVRDEAGREFEVYYLSNNSGDFITAGSPKYDIDKTGGIGYVIGQGSSGSVDGGWVKTVGSSSFTSKAPLSLDEFQCQNSNYMGINNSKYIELHIKGFDQFSMIANDKSTVQLDNKTGKDKKEGEHLKIIIDEEITRTAEDMKTTDPSLFRFDISTGEHVIKIMGTGSTDNRFRAFSLREAQSPMVSYVKGNDSTQVVLQTDELKRSIIYYTKYNKFGETKVIWEDKEATGITLSVKSSTEAGDTLVLGGQALCAVGVYPFHVSSFFNGIETKRLPSGKITVASDIHAVGDTVVEVYAGEAMEEMTFSYHALDAATDIHIAWKDDNKPDGISGHGEDGTYYISGTPTQQGEYPFTISVTGGNSVNGIIKVEPAIVGDNLVLYLYTNGDKESILAKDGIAALLSKQFTLVPRKALKSGLRPIADYRKYKWALISEDANADNAEVIALDTIHILPVLNMKGFSYADERMGWGDPNNGSLTENGQYITVQRDDHPIFQTLGWKHGEKIKVLKKIDEKGLMPIDINAQGTLCLATSLSRAKDDYNGDGDPFTFLHESPAGMSGTTNKYICMPIAMSSSKNLTQEGQYLLASVVNYLLNDEPSVSVPQLQIHSFIIDGITGNIDQTKKRITFEIDLKEHFDVDKHAIKPEITIADETYTHVSTKFEKDGYVDFSESWSYPVVYEVSDYINRQVYEVAIRFFSSEGIEDVYAAGDWVNIYDIFGRKVSTTNEDIYHMVLPRGVYVIVTETGQTFKIMR